MEQRNKTPGLLGLFFKMLGGAIREVFRHVIYVILAFICAALLFMVMVYLPNFRLILNFVFNPNNPIGTKVGLLMGLLGGIQTNATAYSGTITILVSVLFGIDLAMLAYQWKRQVFANGGFAGSAGGMISGVLGVGCSTCGSFLGTAIFASLGASGAIALLPLRGGEFGILGIVLLLLSITSISKTIQKSEVCPIESMSEIKK